MLQSIENNAGIIGEDLALLCNYYVILTIRPSSAAAECVFSLLENSITKRQECSCITIHHFAIQQQAFIFVCNVQVFIII